MLTFIAICHGQSPISGFGRPESAFKATVAASLRIWQELPNLPPWNPIWVIKNVFTVIIFFYLYAYRLIRKLRIFMHTKHCLHLLQETVATEEYLSSLNNLSRWKLIYYCKNTHDTTVLNYSNPFLSQTRKIRSLLVRHISEFTNASITY